MIEELGVGCHETTVGAILAIFLGRSFVLRDFFEANL